MKANGKFVLIGTDCDGETREFDYNTIEAARKTAANCTCTDASGPAWKSWAIWGNDPITEEWRELESNYERNERKHLVESAGYWFRAARTNQNAGRMADALFSMENAYNHVENALAASRRSDDELVKALKMVLHCNDYCVNGNSKVTQEFAKVLNHCATVVRLSEDVTEFKAGDKVQWDGNVGEIIRVKGQLARVHFTGRTTEGRFKRVHIGDVLLCNLKRLTT